MLSYIFHSLLMVILFLSHGLWSCFITEYHRSLPKRYQIVSIPQESSARFEEPSSLVTNDDSPKRLFEEYWQWTLKMSPEVASFLGYHEDDDKMDPHNLKHFDNLKTSYRKFLERIRKLSDSVPDHEDQVNLKILKWEIESLLTGDRFKRYYFGMNNMDGQHLDFDAIIQSQKFKNVDDYQKYIKRLKGLAVQIYEDIELMRMALRERKTYPNESMNEVPQQISELLVNPKETMFYKPFQEFPSTISEDSAQELRSTAVRIIKDEIQVAFKTLQKFITQEYMHGLRPEIGLHSIPDGKEYYRYCIRKYTSTEMKPEEIYKLGLKEVSRIDKLMQNIIRELGSNDSLRDFSQKLRKDPRFIFKSKEEKLEAVRRNIIDLIDPILTKIFWEKPKIKLEIQSIPDSKSKGPAAYYYEGNIENSRPGIVYFNTKYFMDFPKYDLLTDCMHESNPGHHYQMSYFLTKPHVPKFRQNDVSNTFGAFREGWALYAEYLGLELGLFSDLYDRYGHFSWENFRASRLVVDTGIHYFGWSKEDAIEFLFEHTAASEREIEQEVNRYITDPGQACSYKIGETRIRELRKKAEKELDSRFDIRDFHKTVLECGNAPLTVLDFCVDEYIKKTKDFEQFNKPLSPVGYPYVF